MMDLKEIIRWSLKNWYWYVVSIVCCFIVGAVYYKCVPPYYRVTASLMLRHTDNRQMAQDDVINMMSFGGGKITSDEVKILTSQSLMQKVVERLNMTTICARKSRGFWYDQYPNPDFSVVLPSDSIDRFLEIDFVLKNGQIHSLKVGNRGCETNVGDAVCDTPIKTCSGVISIVCNNSEAKNGHYRITVCSRQQAANKYMKELAVNRLSRDSKIINISAISRTPERAVEVINTLLLLYNEQAVSDKNMVAMQAEQFISERLDVLAAQLDSAEAALEQYKRQYRISDIVHSADSYRNYSDQYQSRVAEMDAEADVLDFMHAQISKPENENQVIPGNLGLKDDALLRLVIDYNTLVLDRSKLLQTATPDNPSVIQLTEQVQNTRMNLLSAIEKARLSLQKRREHERSQQVHYDARLSELPQQEKRYQEMLRDREAKEKAYLYLVEKKEGNTLLLVSGGLPAKIIDPAIISSKPESPNLRFVMLVAFAGGILLPLLVFLFGVFKREYNLDA